LLCFSSFNYFSVKRVGFLRVASWTLLCGEWDPKSGESVTAVD